MFLCCLPDEWRFDIMPDLKQLKKEILAAGRIDDKEVARLRGALHTDLGVERDEVEFLITLRNEAVSVCPAFEQLFFAALKDNVLEDGSIDAEETAWLRRMLFADGKIDDREKAFLRELLAESREACTEFQTLCDECLRQ
jgi:hypothetical protein